MFAPLLSVIVKSLILLIPDSIHMLIIGPMCISYSELPDWVSADCSKISSHRSDSGQPLQTMDPPWIEDLKGEKMNPISPYATLRDHVSSKQPYPHLHTEKRFCEA